MADCISSILYVVKSQLRSHWAMMETSFFLGRATLIPKVGSEMVYWREKLFVMMYRNASSAMSFYKIPTNRVVELGAQVVL